MDGTNQRKFPTINSVLRKDGRKYLSFVCRMSSFIGCVLRYKDILSLYPPFLFCLFSCLLLFIFVSWFRIRFRIQFRIRFRFWQSYFIKLFGGGLLCKFIRTFLIKFLWNQISFWICHWYCISAFCWQYMKNWNKYEQQSEIFFITKPIIEKHCNGK